MYFNFVCSILYIAGFKKKNNNYYAYTVVLEYILYIIISLIVFLIISMYLYSTRLSTRIVGFLAREDKRCCANRQVSKWTSSSKLSTAIYPRDHLRIMKTVTVGIPTSVLSIYFTSKTWRCTYTGCNKYIWLMLKLFFQWNLNEKSIFTF